MILKKLVWCVLASSWIVATQGKPTNNFTLYTITEEDDDEKIAKKLGIKLSDLHAANSHVNWNRMRPGATLNIPQHSHKSSTKNKNTSNSKNSYTITEIDNDEIIAKKLGVRLSDLHDANPQINWNRMRPGTILNIPQHSSHSFTKKGTSVQPANTYVVTDTDDDLKIARKLGIKLSVLHRLNPTVDWNRMGPGLLLKTPSSTQLFSYENHHSAEPVESKISQKGPSEYRHKKIRTNRAQTCCDDVTIRNQPSTNGLQLTQVELNSVGKILDRESGWYKIRFKKGIEGWVRGDMIEPYQTIKAAKFAKKERQEKSSNFLASKGKKKRVRHRRNNGIVLSEKDLEGIKDPSMINFAKQYLGVRYRFSGTSSRGFDCSGFTSHVYKRHGISLPHSSRKQSSRGKQVSSSELKTGDLVFFKTNGRRRVNHVGIYVGGGKFIHASSGGGKVQINKLNEGYYARRFAGGRRVK